MRTEERDMKAKRVLAVILAAAAALASAMTASAVNLTEVVYPSLIDPDKNDAYYALCASPYFVNGNGEVFQGEETRIDDNGNFAVEYKISPILADPRMGSNGSMEEIGVIIRNVDRALETADISPDEAYPLPLNVKDAKFVDMDGTETVFNNMLNITEMNRDAQGDIVFRIRAADKIDAGTGKVTVYATPEAAGWDEAGAFNGGTLFFYIELGEPAKDADPPSVGVPYTIGIKDHTGETVIGYKEEHVFTADITDLPDGAGIQWFVNGQLAGTGVSCTVKGPTDDYSVQAKLIGKDGSELAKSVLLNVKVKNDFFAKIRYFLMKICSVLSGAIGYVVNKIRDVVNK